MTRLWWFLVFPLVKGSLLFTQSNSSRVALEVPSRNPNQVENSFLVRPNCLLYQVNFNSTDDGCVPLPPQPFNQTTSFNQTPCVAFWVDWQEAKLRCQNLFYLSEVLSKHWWNSTEKVDQLMIVNQTTDGASHLWNDSPFLAEDPTVPDSPPVIETVFVDAAKYDLKKQRYNLSALVTVINEPGPANEKFFSFSFVLHRWTITLINLALAIVSLTAMVKMGWNEGFVFARLFGRSSAKKDEAKRILCMLILLSCCKSAVSLIFQQHMRLESRRYLLSRDLLLGSSSMAALFLVYFWIGMYALQRLADPQRQFKANIMRTICGLALVLSITRVGLDIFRLYTKVGDYPTLETLAEYFFYIGQIAPLIAIALVPLVIVVKVVWKLIGQTWHMYRFVTGRAENDSPFEDVEGEYAGLTPFFFKLAGILVVCGISLELRFELSQAMTRQWSQLEVVLKWLVLSDYLATFAILLLIATAVMIPSNPGHLRSLISRQTSDTLQNLDEQLTEEEAHVVLVGAARPVQRESAAEDDERTPLIS